MFACNKTFSPFNRPQKSFVFVGVNCVLDVLLMRSQFQVVQPIIGAVKIFMVNFQSAFNWPVKRFPNYSVKAFSSVLTILNKINLQIMLGIFSGFKRAMCAVANPSFTLLNGMRGGYTRTQKSSNFFKGSAVFKHLFSVWNFGSVKRFASSNSAHVSKIAHFVQSFKIQNWFPCFHTMPLFNVNRSIT